MKKTHIQRNRKDNNSNENNVKIDTRQKLTLKKVDWRLF